jgi:hypothetical protein
LRPSIALNQQGWPAVAWHADRSSEDDVTDYAVYYSYAITGSDSGVDLDWVAPTDLDQGRPSMLGSAAVGVGKSSGERQLLHFAYMQQVSPDAWDVYYDSNEELEYVYLPLMARVD